MKHGSIGSYTFGFVASIALTLVAYFTATQDFAHGWALAGILLALASIQLWVQLVYFLHLGKGAGTRWNVTAFVYAAFMILIVGIGSLWIMDNLRYSHVPAADKDLTPREIDNFIVEDEGY
jgi:cytochrome o ubiquinol oxidase subunit IV